MRWYLQLPSKPVNSELATGIFESQYADIEQKELEKAVPSTGSSTEKAIVTLALLEVRRQFSNRPCPSDPKAASAWSRKYWALFESVKSRDAGTRTSREPPAGYVRGWKKGHFGKWPTRKSLGGECERSGRHYFFLSQFCFSTHARPCERGPPTCFPF